MDMDATMWILIMEGIKEQSKQKHPAVAPVEGIEGQSKQKHPVAAYIEGIAGLK